MVTLLPMPHLVKSRTGLQEGAGELSPKPGQYFEGKPGYLEEEDPPGRDSRGIPSKERMHRKKVKDGKGQS